MAVVDSHNRFEKLEIHLLGGFRVCIGEQEVDPELWKLRKAKNLVKLLALAPNHRLHKEKLMDALWPESDPRTAANSLNHALHIIRTFLKQYSEDPYRYLQFENEIISLCPEMPIWIDVEAFESAAKEAKQSHALESYQAALAFYTGDLLPEDLYEDWAINRRDGLRQEYINLSYELARQFEEKVSFADAIETYQRIVGCDSLQEEAYHGLMHAYALSGKRSQALAQYKTLREVLQRELGAEPDQQTTFLYHEILSGRFSYADSHPSANVSSVLRHNLPHQISTFIGREKEIEQVERLTTQSRLVTLTGPGGVGKTRLALLVAQNQLAAYPDGVWLVELDALAKGQLVPYAVAAVFGVKEEEEGKIIENLKESLRAKKLLLVLDNCEHLLEACARLSETVLQACPSLHILATSREVLGIKGEIVYHVPSLTFPDPSSLPPATSLTEYEAVRLFEERAQAVRPSFVIMPENAPSIVQICQQLDGIPLAIELAAPLIGVLSAEQIATRLDDRFRLLTSNSLTAVPRQQTLQASIDWSYDLLSEAERNLFLRLSIFTGGWDLMAAEEVCSESAVCSEDLLHLLSQLIHKSLVVVDSEPGKETRYQLLETIRQYALEKIKGAEDWIRVNNRHLSYYLHLVEEIEPKLKTGEQVKRMRQLQVEQGNLRRALTWSLVENRDLLEKEGLRMASALSEFWDFFGLLAEGYEWLRRGLDFMESGNEEFSLIRAKALGVYGMINVSLHLHEAKRILEESLKLYRKCKDKAGIAQVLIVLCNPIYFHPPDNKKVHLLLDEAFDLAYEVGDSYLLAKIFYLKAITSEDNNAVGEYAEESLRLFQETGNQWGMIDPLEKLGGLSIIQGDYKKTQSYVQEMLRLARESEDKRGLAIAYAMAAFSAAAQGDFIKMEASFRDVLSIYRELGFKGGMVWALRQLGIAAKGQEEYHMSADYLLESLSLGEKINDEHGIIMFIGLIAGLAAGTGLPERAALLLGAEEALLESSHLRLDQAEKVEVERDLVRLRAQIDEATFSEYWGHGRKMTMEQAVAEAVAIGTKINP